ncbi:TetR/AcrR family transcriptional regulator [Paenibacillus sp. GCM10027626]|uniref:TetR/AcrR family transcriptional regulator n=1 Tax=Paenibacillus sp. GCM10027626 TaxID=3273411 RepID=UPI0036433D35
MSNKKEESKKRILDAAKQCFAESGYNNTSVRQICDAADANLALVSYYFGSKENLYYAVIERLTQDVSSLFNQGQKQIEEPAEELCHFIQLFLRARYENKLFHMILKHELSSSGPLKQAIRNILTPCFDYLRTILTSGKEQDVFHFESLPQIEMYIISILVYPAYDSLLTEAWAVGRDADAGPDYEIKQTTHFVLSGLSQR